MHQFVLNLHHYFGIIWLLKVGDKHNGVFPFFVNIYNVQEFISTSLSAIQEARSERPHAKPIHTNSSSPP
jgi:hypothetical protein